MSARPLAPAPLGGAWPPGTRSFTERNGPHEGQRPSWAWPCYLGTFNVVGNVGEPVEQTGAPRAGSDLPLADRPLRSSACRRSPLSKRERTAESIRKGNQRQVAKSNRRAPEYESELRALLSRSGRWRGTCSTLPAHSSVCRAVPSRTNETEWNGPLATHESVHLGIRPLGFGWQAHHVPSIVHAKEREAVGRPSFSHLVGITRLTRMHSSTQRACEVHRSEPYRCEQRARRYDYRRQPCCAGVHTICACSLELY